MPFQIIELPYRTDALEPFISKRTFEFHYGKHYKKYVSNLNEFASGTRFEHLTIEDVILENFQADNAIFRNAAQAWNHAFFWNCISPEKTQPTEVAIESIEDQFGTLEEFEDQFSASANSLFGSGWVWLVREPDGDLSIEALANAGNPLTKGQVPLLVLDVWEHAYYLDYQNERSQYVKQFWRILNWKFLEKNLSSETLYGEHQQRGPFVETPVYSD